MRHLNKLMLAALFVSIVNPFAMNAKADSTKNFYLAPEVAYVLPTDGAVDDSIFLGAKLGYQLDSEWALELESGWMDTGWDASDRYQNVDVTQVPVLLNVRYGQRCSASDPGWYTYVGGGYSWNDLGSNDLGADIDDSWIWQVGVGGEIQLTEGIDGFLEVRYLQNRADVEAAEVVEAVKDDVNASSVLFTAGVKF